MSEDKMSHKKAKNVRIIALIFLLLLVLLFFGWLLFLSSLPMKTTTPKEKDDIKPSKIWTIEDINKLAGCEFEPRDWTLMHVECRFLRFDDEPQNNYQKVQYYLFDTADEANYAFLKLKNDGLKEQTMEATGNTLYGWLEEVYDADIECFFLKKGNLLIEAEGVYGNFYSSDEEEQVQAANKKEREEFEELKAWIPENFSDI